MNNNSLNKLSTSSKTYLDCAHLPNQVCDVLISHEEKFMSSIPSVSRPSSQPVRPCASRYFLCDTERFPESVLVQEPKSLPASYAPSFKTVPRPTAGLNTRAPLSNSTDVALLGEPSAILLPVTTRKYLPCIGDLLPAKQQAPSNISGEFLFPCK